jgi:hypothetical protein
MNLTVFQKTKITPLPVETDRSNHNVVAEYGNLYTQDEIVEAQRKLSQARNEAINRNHFLFSTASNLAFEDASSWLKTCSLAGFIFYFNTGFVVELSVTDLSYIIEHEIKSNAFNFLAMKTVF